MITKIQFLQNRHTVFVCFFSSDCLSCKAAMLNEECQFHKINYNHIKDTPILSKARTSIPGCLALQPTSTFGNYNVYLGLFYLILVAWFFNQHKYLRYIKSQ